jgi:hypothetical protein
MYLWDYYYLENLSKQTSVSDAEMGLEEGLQFCTSKMFPGDAGSTGPGTTHGELLL